MSNVAVSQCRLVQFSKSSTGDLNVTGYLQPRCTERCRLLALSVVCRKTALRLELGA